MKTATKLKTAPTLCPITRQNRPLFEVPKPEGSIVRALELMIPACSSRKSREFYAGNLGKDAAPERRVRRAWRPLGHTPDASPTPLVDSPHRT